VDIYGFSTGRVRPKRAERGARRYLPGGWSDSTEPVNVFAVTHPDGVLLFDTGQSSRAARRGYFPWWHPYLRLARFELGREDEAAAQLSRLGIRPADVRWVVLSHLHTDHVGGVGAFRSAEVLVSRTEWERATGIRGRVRGYLPQHWPKGLVPRLVDLDGPSTGPFAGSYDVAGDGQLVLVGTPGHTPGHLALLARDGQATYLLAGDLVHAAGELDARVRAIADFCRAEGVVVLATHDPEAVSRLADARS
jgi:N-acyl homoserine lactone hydrolase